MCIISIDLAKGHRCYAKSWDSQLMGNVHITDSDSIKKSYNITVLDTKAYWIIEVRISMNQEFSRIL